MSGMAIQGMVTRTGWNGETWGGNQRISIDEALRISTLNGAYNSHEWKPSRARSRAGKLADFVVLSDDPHTIRVDTIKDLAIVKTVVGGVAVYQA